MFSSTALADDSSTSTATLENGGIDSGNRSRIPRTQSNLACTQTRSLSHLPRLAEDWIGKRLGKLVLALFKLRAFRGFSAEPLKALLAVEEPLFI